MRSLAFFMPKGGVGRTTLVYHLAHLWADQGKRVLLVDLDPQAALTTLCLSEDEIEAMWTGSVERRGTLFGAIRPGVVGTGDVVAPRLHHLSEGLALVAGDLELAAFEHSLADDWSRALVRHGAKVALHRHSAFARVIAAAGADHDADIVLVDLGPSLGAINRAALLAIDHIITPLNADLFSLQALRMLGLTLTTWRAEWRDRIAHLMAPPSILPDRAFQALGYVVTHTGLRLNQPAKTYQRWLSQLPRQFHRSLLGDDSLAE
ncbi:MAG: ParA family protein, partial [Myxococcales bacterium]|nr:ParA family protein [Myxococcales bacterium]